MTRKILALEPFYGGSHRAFLDGWQKYSRHQFTVLGLPAHKWKWRMRHSAVTFARQVRELPAADRHCDLVWCSDMLNLAEFIGLAPPEIRNAPRVAYFHENQLTYPNREPQERDLHFAFSNFTTAVAAHQVWFNSLFHREDFLAALRVYLSRMPDHRMVEEIESIRDKSHVHSPGVELAAARPRRADGPVRICWNARWEHDKNPSDFFATLRLLKSSNVKFRLIVLGQSFHQSPEIFGVARHEFAEEIEHWGFVHSDADYRRLLSSADVVVSTAKHEFFGIGVVEAVAFGVIPVLPNRLAYPEVLTALGLGATTEALLYDGSVEQLAVRLRGFAGSIGSPETQEFAGQLQRAAARFAFAPQAAAMDERIDRMTT